MVEKQRHGWRAAAMLLMVALLMMGACSPPEAEETAEGATATPPADEAHGPVATEAPGPEPTEAPPTVEIPPLTDESLVHGEYTIEELGTFQLRDGIFEARYGEGATQVNRVGLEAAALGDLDGDGVEDGAALLWWESGGSGTFKYLAAVVAEAEGPRQAGLFFLGDRVWLKRLRVEAGEIVLELLSHASEDPRCCPSQQLRQRYVLSGGAVVMSASELIGRETGQEALLDVIWSWEAGRNLSGREDLVVPNPAAYRLELNPDGQYQAQADCVLALGSFVLGDELLRLGPAALTPADCELSAYRDDYFGFLEQVDGAALAGEQMILALAGGGELVFSPLQAVTGLAAGPEGAEIPAGALVVVEVVDAEGTRLGGQSQPAPGGFPVDFKVSFDPAAIRPEASYFLRGWVEDEEGRPLFGSVDQVPVLTQGSPTYHLMLALEAAAPVEGSWWWEGTTTPMGPITVPDPEKYRLELLPGGELRLTADCRSGRGTYTVEGSGIQIVLDEISDLDCGPDSLSEVFVQDLQAAAIFFFQEKALFFDLIYDSGTMRFSPAD